MRRARHRYHYAVRYCKKNIYPETKIGRKFDQDYRILDKKNPTSKIDSTSIDHTNSPLEISKLFLKKYRLLYNRVLTDNIEFRSLHVAINNGINNDSMIVITPEIIKICTKKLKPVKDDGDMSFKSDHLIHQLHVVLSMFFNMMLINGYTLSVLLKSTILSIPKDYKTSLSSSDNYRDISLFNCISK